jgi:hypothetical protein
VQKPLNHRGKPGGDSFAGLLDEYSSLPE